MVEKGMSEYVGVYRVNGQFEVVEVDGSLKAYQSLVGGYIETVPTFRSPYLLLLNEEGKFEGLKPNWKATFLCPQLVGWDVIVGDVVVVQLNRKRDDWCGWKDEGQCRFVCEMLLCDATH